MSMKPVFQRIKSIISRALRQGWGPESLCRAVAWGVTVGVFPIYGLTTALLGVIGYVGKMNHAVLQAFNYLVAPVKVAMILPFIRLGEFLFQETDPFLLSLSEFTRRFQSAPWETLSRFSMTFLYAIAGWVVMMPILWVGSWLVAKSLIKTSQAAHAVYKERTV